MIVITTIITSNVQEANVKARVHGSPQQFACLLCGHKTKASWFRLVDHFQVILQPCFFITYHNADFKVHPIPEGAEVSCPEENGGCGQPFPDLVWPQCTAFLHIVIIKLIIIAS